MKMMAVRKVVFLVICLAAVSSIGWCSSEQVKGKAEDAMETISDKDKMKDAAGAVFDKVGDAFNKSSDMARELMDKAPDIADSANNLAADVANNPSHVVGKVKEKVSDMAGNTADKVSGMAGRHTTDTGKYTKFKVSENAIDAYSRFNSDKGGEAIYYASHTAGKEKESGKDKVNDPYGAASEKAGEAMRKVSKMDGDGKEMVKDASDKVGEKNSMTSKTSSEVKEKAKEAKDSPTEKAKTNSEVAKEKASDATGKVGESMGDGTAEL